MVAAVSGPKLDPREQKLPPLHPQTVRGLKKVNVATAFWEEAGPLPGAGAGTDEVGMVRSDGVALGGERFELIGTFHGAFHLGPGFLVWR